MASEASKTTLLQVINFAQKFHGGSVGVYGAKQGTQSDTYNHFWGVYGNYAVAHRMDLNYEYLKNTSLGKKGM